MFKCEDGYDLNHLFNKNHDLNTECLRNISWSNEHLFECWGGSKYSFLNIKSYKKKKFKKRD